MGVPLPRGLTCQGIVAWDAAPLSGRLRGREVMTEVEESPCHKKNRRSPEKESSPGDRGKYAVSEKSPFR